MGKWVLVLIILLIVNITLAADDYLSRETLEIKQSIVGNVDVLPKLSDYSIDRLTVSLEYVPKSDYRQEVVEIRTEPLGNIDKDYTNIVYTWDKPKVFSFPFRSDSTIKTFSDIKQVNKKTEFPIKELDSTYYPYTQPTQEIDVNQDIRDLASNLANSKTDLYEVEFTLAEWVRSNVNYNLSSLGAESVQKSSWVLQNKQGVCDEITNLFISLNRALGIPARYSSGIAYTNLDSFSSHWVPHAWAEVYFPDIGWVPFDVTYGEYGFIDAGHIKLTETTDSAQETVKYEYLGSNIDIKTDKLDIRTYVINKGEYLNPNVAIGAEMFRSQVGFGSYNLVIATAHNMKNYYVTSDLYLSRTDQLEIIGNYRQEVLLKPYEEKKVYWIVKVADDLNENYYYTFPVTIVSARNESAKTQFTSKANYEMVDYNSLKKIIEQSNEENAKEYSQNIIMECAAGKTELYMNDSTIISCTLDNKGDEQLKNVNICLNNADCFTRNIGIEKIKFNFTKKFTTLGLKTLIISAKNELISKSGYVVINILDIPSLKITNLKYPEQIHYNQPGEIDFSIERISKPINVHVALKHDTIGKDWYFTDFNDDQNFKILIKGNELMPNKNNAEIIVDYEDEKGNKYSTKKDFSFAVTTDNFWETIVLYMNVAGAKISGLFG